VTIRPSFINIRKNSGGKKWASNGFIRMVTQDLIKEPYLKKVAKRNK